MNKVTIAITDSGLGGLSVAAEVFETILKIPDIPPTEIAFVNALPEAGKGYNTMKNVVEKIETFNDVLFGIQKHFNPALIGIACNTLSALVNKTQFFEGNGNSILNIIDLALEIFSEKGGANSKVIVFGTETTIESEDYARGLLKMNFSEEQIISISCPRLASEIELNYKSTSTKEIVEKCVKKALAGICKNEKVFVLLGCTHYPYVRQSFEYFFELNGVENFEIVNPNKAMVDKIVSFYKDNFLSRGKKKNTAQAEIKVYSKAEILPEEIESVSALLGTSSPATANALKNYIRQRDLF